MPAFKTTLRFFALGACADVATAFGTFEGSFALQSESAGLLGAAAGDGICKCDEKWYCKITGSRSLSINPIQTSGPDAIRLAQYVSYCWNNCFKDPLFLDPDYWTGDGCMACEDYKDTLRVPPSDLDGNGNIKKWSRSSYAKPLMLGEYGCQCGTQATDWEDCSKGDAGLSPASLWRSMLCDNSGDYTQARIDGVEETFICLLGGTERTDNAGNSRCRSDAVRETQGLPPLIAPRGNPFQDSYRWFTSDKGDDEIKRGGGWLQPICTAGAGPSEDCGGPAFQGCDIILSEGSQDITDSSCEAIGPWGTTKNCTKLYSYSTVGENRVGKYCEFDFGSELAWVNDGTFEAACKTYDEETCPTIYTRPAWGKTAGRILYCGMLDGKCTTAAANLGFPKIFGNENRPYSCQAPPDQVCEVGSCKAKLCGTAYDQWTAGVRVCDAACDDGAPVYTAACAPPASPPSSQRKGVQVVDGGSGRHTTTCIDPVSAISQIQGKTIAAQCCDKGHSPNGKGGCRRVAPGKRNDDAGCIAGFARRGDPPHPMTYAEARAECAGLGLEMCTKNCAGTGCFYNNHPVYTSQECDL